MLNQCNFIGNITKDFELRFVAGSGTAVATSTLAVNQKYKDKEEVLFLPLVVWGNTAEAVTKYTSKGSKIFVSGRLVIRKYEGRDGQEKSITELHPDKVVFLDSKKKQDEQTPPAFDDSMIGEEDTPF